jgi:hypothetical protein
MRDEEIQAEIEDFIEGFNQPTYHGMRVNGQRIATCHPSTDGQAIAGPMRSGFIKRGLLVGDVVKILHGDPCRSRPFLARHRTLPAQPSCIL